MHRPTVGLIALGLLLAAAALWVWPVGGGGDLGLRPACLRIGLVMGALWLALPQLQGLPGWLLRATAVAAIVIAWRPKLALVLVPLALAWLALRRRAPRR